VVAQSAQVNGDWEVTLNSPQGASTIKASFKQDGDKVSGVFKSPRGEMPVQVAVKGKEIEIKFSVKFQDNDLPITLKGMVEGSEMKGTADFGGFAEGDWLGKRAAEGGAATSSSASSSSGSAMNVTGDWAFEVETAAGSGSPSFTFKQDGETLTGQYKGQLGEGPVKGTVKGSEINFTIEISQGTLVYKGMIEKDGTMKGTVSLGDMGSGTWKAKRK
jgi:hypothetical protein